MRDNMQNGSIAKAWNDTVVAENKPYEPRDYLWASEIGNADIDVFLRMKGEQPTNRPDLRSRRKFDVGNLFEGIVANVLDRAGVVVWLPKDEKRVYSEEPDLLKVSGRFDILLDGKADLERAISTAQKELDDMKYDNPYEEYRLNKAIKLAEKLQESGEEIEFNKVIAEVKSMSLFIYNMVEESKEPVETHALQTYHYARYNNIGASKTGRLFCVCRDDIRLQEFGVSGGEGGYWREAYMDSLKRKTEYFKNNELPPKEPMLVVRNGKISANFNVGYSGYLKKIYGYEHTEEYRDAWGKKATSWSRVIKRVVNGDKMTASNIKYIDEMREHFGEDGYDQLVKDSIKAAQVKYVKEQKGE